MVSIVCLSVCLSAVYVCLSGVGVCGVRVCVRVCVCACVGVCMTTAMVHSQYYIITLLLGVYHIYLY